MHELKMRLSDKEYSLLERALSIWGRTLEEAKGYLHSGAMSSLVSAMYYMRPTWPWPYWVKEQFDPESRAYLQPHSNPYYNRHYRSWAMIGTRRGVNEGIVFRDGHFMPRRNCYSFILWMYDYDAKRLFVPGYHGEIRQRLISSGIPIVLNEWVVNENTILSRVFATRYGDLDVGILVVTIRNESSRRKHLKLFIALRPWGPDAPHEVKEVEYSEETTCLVVDGKLALVPDEPPSDYACSDFVKGDVYEDALDGSLSRASRAHCELGYATAALGYDVHLPARGHKILAFKIPLDPVEPSIDLIRSLRALDHRKALLATYREWAQCLSRGMSIKMPEHHIVEAFQTSVMNLLLLHDEGRITPGPTVYHMFWVRDSAMMITALDATGFFKEAEEAVRHLLSIQQPDGLFRPTEFYVKEWDANGEALWTIAQHFKFTRNRELILKHKDKIMKAIEWLKRAREETMKDEDKGKPHYGLLPKSWSAEDTGPFDYYYWDVFWAIAGLRDIAQVLKDVNLHKEAEEALMLMKEFEKSLFSSLDYIYRERNIDFIPATPYRGLDSALSRSLGALWPCRVLKPDDPRLLKTLDLLIRHFAEDGGVFHRHAWGCYGSYLTMILAHALLIAGRKEETLKHLKWILAHRSPTNGWAEGISPLTGEGGFGDAPHGWACAEYIWLIRDMLVREEDNHLVLMGGIPYEFIGDSSIEVVNAPTHFGTLSYTSKVEGRTLSLQVKLLDEGYPQPEHIVVDLWWASEIVDVESDVPEYEVVVNKVKVSPRVTRLLVEFEI
ncbi:MAG: hypothetical protein DRN15_01660 [Thermoprotei archaeon]|nr:MAG: hypothetical protein DRN15_01660 [Thermoprotei archaeon]